MPQTQSESQLVIPEAKAFEKPQPEVTPMQMVAAALRQGAGIDIIERLVALQERMLAREAEVAFNISMNRAQEAMAPVRADLTNPQTHSKYASYKALDQKVRPIYSKEGFALSFDTGDSPKEEHVRVLCYVTHSSGHSKTYRIDMPADGKGAKGGDVMTKTHATGGATSYGMRYLVKMIFNIAVGEDDKDGNITITMGDLAKHLECIEAAANLTDLGELYRTAVKLAVVAADPSAIKAINASKDKRKKDLGAA